MCNLSKAPKIATFINAYDESGFCIELDMGIVCHNIVILIIFSNEFFSLIADKITFLQINGICQT